MKYVYIYSESFINHNFLRTKNKKVRLSTGVVSLTNFSSVPHVCVFEHWFSASKNGWIIWVKISRDQNGIIKKLYVCLKVWICMEENGQIFVNLWKRKELSIWSRINFIVLKSFGGRKQKQRSWGRIGLRRLFNTLPRR